MLGTIVITGAGHGIGRATAVEAARAGWAVVGCDTDPVALASLVDEMPHSPVSGAPRVVTVDVTNAKAVADVFDEVGSGPKGSLALVNNAGIYLGRTLRDYEMDDIEHVLRVNLVAPILWTTALAAACERSGRTGVIVNVASVSGQEGSSDPVYGASKAGLLGLTKSAALALAPHIRVNAIALGLMDTAMMASIPSHRVAQYRDRELLPDPITPQAVARTIVFMVSRDAEHFTGATFDMNNGCYSR